MKKLAIGAFVLTLSLILGGFIFFHFAFASPNFNLIKNRKNLEEIKSMIKAGDLIYQTTISRQSGPVSKASHSAITHIGIIDKMDGKWVVVEARNPVRIASLEKFQSDGEKKALCIKRMKKPFNVKKVIDNTKKHVGKAYDLLFQWDDKRIYCSELIYKAFLQEENIKFGKINKVKELDFSSFSVQQLMAFRMKLSLGFFNRITYHKMLYKYKTFEAWMNSKDWDESIFSKKTLKFLDSPIITPAAMFHSNLTKTIYSDYLSDKII